VLDAMTAFAVALTIGIALIFAGFLVATVPRATDAAVGASVTRLPRRAG